MTNGTTVSSSSRIPAALQAVFLAGNRGKDVYEPPPNRAADKVYHHNWKFQTRAAHRRNSSSHNGGSNRSLQSGSCRSLFGDSQSKIQCLAKPHIVNVRASEVTNVPRRQHRSPSPRRRTVGEKTKRPATPVRSTRCSSPPPTIATSLLDSNCSPQEFLDAMLQDRGYSTDSYQTLQTAYHNAPTSHQQASYGSKVTEMVRAGDKAQLRCLLQGGISPNPCNAFGESILHLVCRRGNVDMLRCMRQYGTRVQVCDDYGRTPLHDACWAPSPALDVVRELLAVDPRLLYLMDRRGSLPLKYVHVSHWSAWRQFLWDVRDEFFPPRPSSLGPQGPPELARHGPNSRPLPTPEHALPDHLTAMVAQGRLTILKANMVAAEQERKQEMKLKQSASHEDSTAPTWEESDESDYESADDEGSECSEEDECDDISCDSEYDSEDDDSEYDSDDDSCSSSSCDDFPDDLYEILAMTQARLG